MRRRYTKRIRSKSRKTKRRYRHNTRRIQKGGWGMALAMPEKQNDKKMMYGGWGGQQQQIFL